MGRQQHVCKESGWLRSLYLAAEVFGKGVADLSSKLVLLSKGCHLVHFVSLEKVPM